MQLTFGSLFAGIGGFDLGFERSGMVCKWQVEIDDYASRVLAKHWPNVHRERDIRECGRHNLEPVDVICGGFPCQDISVAGNGDGLDGKRSGLFFEAIRVVRELRPQYVVLENVAALLARGLDRVLGALAEIGYDAEWHCIPAAAVGAPHRRDRIFIVSHAQSERCGQGRKRRVACTRSRQEDAADVADANRERCEEQHAPALAARAGFRGRIIDERPTWNTFWDAEPRMGRVVDGVSRGVDRLRGLGNAVVPQVAEYIGRRIVEAFR